MKDEFKNLTPGQLSSQLQESRKELLKLRVQLAAGNASGSGKVRQTKKNIARMIMLLAGKH